MNLALNLKSCSRNYWAFVIAFLLNGVAFGVTGGVSTIVIPKDKVQEAFGAKRLALFVGIENFDDEKFRPLKFPAKDVNDFREFLRNHNQMKGDEYIALLNEAATIQSTIDALNELEAKNTSEDDIILVYFSTHGTLDYQNGKTLSAFTVLRDTRFDQVSETALSVDYLQKRLSRLRSKRKALILALCHSGTGKSQLPEKIQTELSSMKADFFQQPLHEASSAMMVLSASTWGQPAREDNKLRNDIYTHFLLEGLSKNDSNEDGAISLFEAHEYARSQTYDFTRGLQTPTALINLEGMDPIILNGKVSKKPEPMIFADNEQFRNLQLFVDGNLKGTLWEPKLASNGHVHVTLVDPRNSETPIVDHSIFLRSGRAYSVSSLLQRPPAYGIELGVSQLPAPRSFDSLRGKDMAAPGVTIRASDVLGTPFAASFAYHATAISKKKQVDFEENSVKIQMSTIHGDIAFGYFPTQKIGLSLGLGIERLTVDRSLSNGAFENMKQKAFVTYPTVSFQTRFFDLFGPIYSGIGASVIPTAKKQGLKIEGETNPLQPATGSAFAGILF